MIATHTSEAPAHQKRSSCWALVSSWQQLFAGHSTLDTQQVDMFTHEKKCQLNHWTMCEYNVCITNASVIINYRAFDLVYTVNLALSQNILRHLATELLYPPPDQRASIYHAGPAGSRDSAVGRIYNTMHASWSSPACLWKNKQTGLNSKFPVGASSKSCFLEHISCGIQCMRERIKNIHAVQPPQLKLI